MRRITGILLAAGSGSRFGGQKLLHPSTDGTPLGVAAARNLLAVLPHSVAVVRAGDEMLPELLAAEGMRLVANRRADRGLSASLAVGVAASADADGWIVMLADMPFIRIATIQRILALLERGAPLAAPSYRGLRGHPVGIGRAFRDELLALTGDQGAREVLFENDGLLELLEVDDAGVLIDVDTPADIAACLS